LNNTHSRKMTVQGLDAPLFYYITHFRY
jgi:hypothetical protein